MASASLIAKQHASGATYYYAVFRDAAREPRVKWVALNTTDPRIARQRFVTWEREEAMGIADPWSARARAGASGITVGEAIARYKKALTKSARPNTLATRTSGLKHLESVEARGRSVKDIPLTALTPRIVQEATEKPQGRKGGKDGGLGGPAAPATKRAVYDSCDAFLAWCVEQGYLRTHPLRVPGAIEPPPAGVTLEPYHVFTPAELRAITSHIRLQAETTKRRKGRAVVASAAELAVASGLRIGELVQLTWRDVVHRGGSTTVHVVQSQARGQSTKTGKSRIVTVFPLGARALRDLRVICEQSLGRPVRPTDLVVVGPTGAGFDISRLNNQFREMAVEAGVTGAHWHDLRHTFISWSVNELAIPITVARDLAGHGDIRMTASYQRPSPVTMTDSVNRALALAGVAAPVAEAAEPFYVDVARYVAGLPPAEQNDLPMIYAPAETIGNGGNRHEPSHALETAIRA